MAQIKSKTPGMIAAIKVKVGDTVTAGTIVVVMEAMKMQMPIPTPTAGVVKEIKVETGARVGPGAVLVEIE